MLCLKHKLKCTEERMFGKKKLALLGVELIGTAILALAVLSVRNSGIGYSLFVALAAGIAMAAMVLFFSSVSEPQLNPALTIGLWSARKVSTVRAIVFIAAQLLGGAIAYWLYIYFIKTHLPSTAGHYNARVMISEALGTFIFVIGWMAAVTQKYVGLRLAATIGGAFAIGLIIASLSTTGFGLINPALALSSHSWGWSTYVAGPVIGAVVGVNFYHLLYAPGSIVKKAKAKK
jgi:glycerol uptake facilitator-like aquaporin